MKVSQHKDWHAKLYFKTKDYNTELLPPDFGSVTISNNSRSLKLDSGKFFLQPQENGDTIIEVNLYQDPELFTDCPHDLTVEDLTGASALVWIEGQTDDQDLECLSLDVVFWVDGAQLVLETKEE